jgi:uncharacterized SAM-binding protein YcdF (DUF218 family)
VIAAARTTRRGAAIRASRRGAAATTAAAGLAALAPRALSAAVSTLEPGAWAVGAAARGCALFFGAFTLVGLVGAARAGASGFDPTIWWVELPERGPHGSVAFLTSAGIVLVAYAVAPRMRVWRRRATVLVALVLVAATAANGVEFYEVWRAGQIRPSVPLPLSFVLCALMLLVAGAAGRAPAPERRRPSTAAVVALSAIACLAAFPLAQVLFFGETDYRREAAVAVVLGAQVYEDGRPSTSLADRMNTAVDLYHSGLAKKLLVSGGVGKSGLNEAYVMRDLAVAAGVPAEDVLVDGEGVSTQATVRNTAALLRAATADGGAGAPIVTANGEPPTVLAVSQFYHLPRVKLAFARAGFDVLTVPARGSRPIARTPELVAREIPAFWAYYLRAVFG